MTDPILTAIGQSAATAMQAHKNAHARSAPFPNQAGSLTTAAMAAAMHEISSWDGYTPTPLHSLDDVAATLGVKSVYYKDESPRFGLGSFKALGGAYAVAAMVATRVAAGAAPASVTVATATDGNHGRSVSWGAQRAGCAAKIYIHAHVSEARADAMRAFGADVIRVDGNYEASLAACKDDAAANGWDIVSDTSWEGYVDIPLDIMAGYTVMTTEALAQMGTARPTHAFLPIGVGGLAAAVAAPLWQDMDDQLCRLISVESRLSSCFFDSIVAGKPTLFDITEETLMAGLSCGEVSLLAWELLSETLSHCMTIGDDAVAPLMKWFHQRSPAIEAGECATSGLTALLAAHADPAQWRDMGFGPDSVVLLIGTEGATDRDLYNELVTSA